MVPLRIDANDVRPARTETIARPRLVLTELTPEASPRRRSRRSPLRRLESVLAIAAAAAVLLYFLIGFALSVFHSVQQNYALATTPSVVMIPITVARGDTLSKLAIRYGDPAAYLPELEQQIIDANHLSGKAPLHPGQHLRIPVTNSLLIAQIQKNYHLTRLASR